MPCISSRYPRWLRVASLLSLLSVLALPSHAYAARPEASLPDASPAKSVGVGNANMIARLQQRYFRLRLQVGHIEAVALKNSPDLVRKQKAFRNRLITVMRQDGSHPRAQIRALRRLSQQVLANGVSPTRRRYLLEEARSKQVKLLAAERQAMQDPRVHAARRDLRRAILVAMSKVNPKSTRLFEQMRSVQRQIAREQGHG